MRRLTFLIVAASSLVCSAPAFARPNKHAQAAEFVPCSTANDGTLICGKLQESSSAPQSYVRQSAFELANSARSLTPEQRAVCQDMLRALPAHQAAMKDAEQAAHGRITYGMLVNESVLKLDALIATRCSAGEQPMDDDGMDDQPPPAPALHIAAR